MMLVYPARHVDRSAAADRGVVNSPGPHDQVRIREPFAGLQAMEWIARSTSGPSASMNASGPTAW